MTAASAKAFNLYQVVNMPFNHARRHAGQETKRPSDCQGPIPMEQDVVHFSTVFNNPSIVVNVQISEDDPHLEQQECPVMVTAAADEVSDEDSETPEAFVVDPDEEPGLAILDTACSRTIHGEVWRKKFEEALSARNLQPSVKAKTQVFRGVGGKITSKEVATFPVGVGGVQGQLDSAQTADNSPMLLSNSYLRSLGAVIDLENNTVDFTKIGVLGLAMRRRRVLRESPRRHRGEPRLRERRACSSLFARGRQHVGDLPSRDWRKRG
jgi:hypothetical protein